MYAHSVQSIVNDSFNHGETETGRDRDAVAS